VPVWQQVAVGDSGVVRAIVRDSAGREIQVSGITFTLRDTTIVQNISAGLAFRTFRARHVGRSLYDVRYNTLADTAVVLVVADSTPPPPPPPPPPDTGGGHVVRIVVFPHSQQKTVGDTGVVNAALFDSAGRVVRDSVTWALGDTTGVLRIRFATMSRVMFEAVGPGRARLIARHEALADTAEVVVVESPVPPRDPVTSIVVSPKRQERLVGDSGVVSASLRDSAGREVWPGEINWDVDTTGVLWLRSNGTSWVVFEARRAGTARAIARHNALADTAVVVVH
jgi:hypothetical protein